MRLSNKIVLASMNPGKFQEFQALFKGYPEIDLVSAEGLIKNPEKLGFAEVHPTYLENSIAKARLANHASHYPALADDTGLEVDGLGGKPGVRSARFAKDQAGFSALSKMGQSEANVKLLLAELAQNPTASRNARFVTVVALLIEGILIHAEGKLEGRIADAPRGSHGFGYDSVFIPQGYDKTLAELTDAEKNAISHRAKAIQALMLQVKARGIVLAKP